jgi:predicted outer membrane repeat protein
MFETHIAQQLQTLDSPSVLRTCCRGSSFNNNSATWGAGFAAIGNSNTDLESTLFSGNTATDSGAGFSASGAAQVRSRTARLVSSQQHAFSLAAKAEHRLCLPALCVHMRSGGIA